MYHQSGSKNLYTIKYNHIKYCWYWSFFFLKPNGARDMILGIEHFNFIFFCGQMFCQCSKPMLMTY